METVRMYLLKNFIICILFGGGALVLIAYLHMAKIDVAIVENHPSGTGPGAAITWLMIIFGLGMTAGALLYSRLWIEIGEQLIIRKVFQELVFDWDEIEEIWIEDRSGSAGSGLMSLVHLQAFLLFIKPKGGKPIPISAAKGKVRRMLDHISRHFKVDYNVRDARM